jgi:hypothetical protein
LVVDPKSIMSIGFRQHRTIGLPKHLFGDRTDHEVFESRQAVRTHHDQVSMARERVLEDPSRGLALVHDDIDTHIAGRCGTHELAYLGEQSISVGLVEDDLCSGPTTAGVGSEG